MTAAGRAPSVDIRVDPWPSEDALRDLIRAGWGAGGSSRTQVLKRSLCHVCAFDGERLVGFVYLAWDGGIHAFVLDPTVHADYRRQGIGTALVRRSIEVARQRGVTWFHVDFEPHLATFYAACGFVPSAAGIMRLDQELAVSSSA